MAPTTLEDVSRSILPLCFESGFEDVHYGTKGTGFLVRRNGALWLATAAHCVPGDRSGVRVPRDEDASEWMTLGDSAALEARDGVEDSASADLAVVRVLNSEAEVAPAINLDAILIASEMASGDLVWVAGYPAVANWIDFDRDPPEHRQQRHRVDAWYDAPDPSSAYMHVILLGFVEATDGLSGSPVFLRHAEKWRFAGVLTRAGGGEWSWGRFVHAELLLNLLTRRGCASGPHDRLAPVERGAQPAPLHRGSSTTSRSNTTTSSKGTGWAFSAKIVPRRRML